MSDSKHFSKYYRRNLVDMHISDPRDDADWSGDDRFNGFFLSEFSPEKYYEYLKLAGVNAPMIYLQSHAGHCYYPTKVGHMHSAFIGKEDMMKRLIDLCHKDGMYVIGYYSLIYNTYEEDRHPEWRIVSPDNTSARQRGGRYGHLCPNNPEYRDFIEEQIKEMAEYFTLDGMFYDMTFWPDICRCEHCMKKYSEAGFDKLPKIDWNDPEFRRLNKFRCEMMGEFARFVTELTRKYIPGASVEHNYAQAVASNVPLSCSTELVNEQCDYTGGDLYGDLYNHSFTAKYYYGCTKHRPFEYMTCRCDSSLLSHTVTKTEERLATEVMLTAAHHGATLIIDAIDPVGTLDRRVYERIGKVFERQLPYEKYFYGDLISDVAVYYSTTGRYNSRGFAYTSKTCSIGAAKALIEAHIPHGIISNAKTDSAHKYKMVMATGIAGMYENNIRDLTDYVKKGGTLYISGVEEPELLKELLSADISGFTEESAVYLAPTDEGQELFGEFDREHPIPTEFSLPILDIGREDIKVLAAMALPYTKKNERKFASIHSNPPGAPCGIPALIEAPYGRGRVIWSAFPIENDGRLSHKTLFCEIVKKYLQNPSLSTSAPRQVELVSFKSEKDILISAVDLFCTDELLPVRDFEISVKTDKKPRSVLLIKDGDEIPVEYGFDGENVKFTVRELVMLSMYRIELL